MKQGSRFGMLAKMVALTALLRDKTEHERQIFFTPKQPSHGGRMAFAFDRHRAHLRAVKFARGTR